MKLLSGISLVFLIFSSFSVMAAESIAVQPDEETSAAEKGQIPGLTEPEGTTIDTKAVEVEIIADDEFDEEVRRFPELMAKARTERLAAKNPYVILPHRPNYFLPLTYMRVPSNDELNRSLSLYADEPVEVDEGYDHWEGIFQISLKYVLREDLFCQMCRLEFGYTNRSFWQLYNQGMSRPFRETNHEPELMFSWPLKGYWVDHLMFSLNHQSNGQQSTLSRSWNRIIVQASSIISRGVLTGKVWYRLPEKDSSDPEDPSDDDNPDILDYMGHGEITYLQLMDQHQFEITIRNNLEKDTNRGAVQLGYSFPFNDRVKGYVQYFNGYGESLIDYNRFQERISIGFKLSDWF